MTYSPITFESINALKVDYPPQKGEWFANGELYVDIKDPVIDRCEDGSNNDGCYVDDTIDDVNVVTDVVYFTDPQTCSECANNKCFIFFAHPVKQGVVCCGRCYPEDS